MEEERIPVSPEDVRAVGVDLDGTLLPESKVITERTRVTIEKLKKEGIIFFPVTGKSLSLTMKIFDGIDVPMVCLEGAYIRVKGKNIWNPDCFIDPAVARFIIDISDGIESFLISNDKVYIRGDVREKQYRHWACDLGGDISNCRMDNLTVLILLSMERDKLDSIRKQVCRNFSDRVVPFLTPVKYLERYYLTFRSPKTGKYKGAARLLAYYGYGLEDMLFIGDWRNDIPILKRVGFPVVMRNAEEKVAGYARAMTLYTNEEDGVSRFLEGFFSL